MLFLLVAGGSAYAQTTLTPVTLSFGNRLENEASAPRTATFKNTQTVALTISSIAISGGTAPGDYAWSGKCPLSPSTLGPGKGCSITVTFTPSALGSRTATLTVADNASTSPQTVSLTGTGVAPVDLTPATLGFGNQLEGTTGTAKTATLKNAQAVPLTINSISVNGAFGRTGGTCPSSGGTLAAHASCTIRLSFTPTAVGSEAGTLSVADNASTSPQTTSLTGKGAAPVTLSVSSLSFGALAVGNTSTTKTVTLTNKEKVALTFSSIVPSGDFAISSNTCGTKIAVGATCKVGMTFSPTTTGARAGALTFSDNAANSPQSVNLTGTGSSPVTVSPANLTLASTTLGMTSAAKIVTLTNHLTTSLTFSTPVATGDFALASNTCGASLGPGLTCKVGVTFKPTVVGPRSGALTIPYTAFGSSSVVTLSGTGNVTGLLSIAVTPANPSILLGQTQQFTAMGHFKSGSTQNLTASVTWSSSAPGVATITAAGLASAIGGGQTAIEAALGAINGSTTLGAAGFLLTGSLNTARDYHTATLLNNGTVLMVGGQDNPTPYLASAELYNPSTGTFSSTTGSLKTPREQHTATLLNNGLVLIVGGYGSGGYLASAELYNPASGTFSPTGSLNNPREYHTATLLSDGTVLIAGGYGPSGLVASAELYNPATGAFTPTTGSLNTPRQVHTATLLNNGMVLLAGGENSGAPLTSAELYDPATETFSFTTGNLNSARASHTATLLNNGMVLLAGGAAESGILASAELYNPATGTFAYTTGSFNTARDLHTATLLNNGMVLMAGGWSPILASAELYDPATETFTVTGSLNTARIYDTATLFNNGMVLMAGGSDSDGSPSLSLASAELFEPATLTPANLVSIAVTPGTSTLSAGTTQQFIATGTFSDASVQQLGSVTWSSSNPTVAQISNDASNHGVGLAVAAGTATITATAGSVSGSATLNVE